MILLLGTLAITFVCAKSANQPKGKVQFDGPDSYDEKMPYANDGQGEEGPYGHAAEPAYKCADDCPRPQTVDGVDEGEVLVFTPTIVSL